MLLHPIDWACVIAFFVVSLVIGVAVTRRAGGLTILAAGSTALLVRQWRTLFR